MLKSIDDAFAAYTLAQLQTFRSMIINLERNELSIGQALRYINFRKKIMSGLYILPCPECGGRMTLSEVNVSKCTNVGGRYKTVWCCRQCGHSILSKKSLLRELKRARRHNSEEIALEESERKVEEWELNMVLKQPLPAKCPSCKAVMYLHKVNTPRGKSNIHGYKSVWFCDGCGYEKYLTHDKKEEAIRLRRI